MMKLLFSLLLFSSALFAKTYTFSETRYSYALDSSVILHGLISFEINSLQIKYDKSDKRIFYDDSILVVKENENIIELNPMQTQRIASFLDILLLLYNNDKMVLKDKFEITKKMSQKTLIPKDELKSYLEKIILNESENELKQVRLILKNSDTITISIDDEVR